MARHSFEARAHRFFSLCTATFALLALVVALALAPARSGPGCTSDCITSPYTDAVDYVPRDFWWMIFAFLLALAVPLMLLTAGEHIREERRVALKASIALGTIAGTILTIAYGTQFLVVATVPDEGRVG